MFFLCNLGGQMHFIENLLSLESHYGKSTGDGAIKGISKGLVRKAHFGFAFILFQSEIKNIWGATERSIIKERMFMQKHDRSHVYFFNFYLLHLIIFLSRTTYYFVKRLLIQTLQLEYLIYNHSLSLVLKDPIKIRGIIT